MIRTLLTNLLYRGKACPRCSQLLLHDPECFAATLQREEARSQRAGRTFVVVQITLQAQSRPGKPNSMVWARPVTRYLRLTDIAGRVDGRRIVVLLTETNEDGARQFSSHIRSRMEKGGLDVDTRLFAYDGVQPRGNGDGRSSVMECLRPSTD